MMPGSPAPRAPTGTMSARIAAIRARPARSTGAVLAGFVAAGALSLGTDALMHGLGVYPPWGEPMYATAPLLLALGYRIAYTGFAGYLTARLAPRRPQRHALILGALGLVSGTAAAITTIPMNLSPAWFPIAIALTALPAAWYGGARYARSVRA